MRFKKADYCGNLKLIKAGTPLLKLSCPEQALILTFAASGYIYNMCF